MIVKLTVSGGLAEIDKGYKIFIAERTGYPNKLAFKELRKWKADLGSIKCRNPKTKYKYKSRFIKKEHIWLFL